MFVAGSGPARASWSRPARRRPRPTTPSATYLGELAERATGSFVFGEDRYDAVLQVGEGFAFGARDAARDGSPAGGRRSTSQMAALAEEIGGTPDWRAVVDRPAGRPPGRPWRTLLALYRDETRSGPGVRARRTASCPFPRARSCAVEPAPLFLRASAPVASYFPPPFFGPPAPGTFNVPFTPDGATRRGAGGPPALELVLRDPRRHGPRGLPRAPPALRRRPGDQRAAAGAAPAPTWSRAGASTSST